TERDHALDRPVAEGEEVWLDDDLLERANRAEPASEEGMLPGFAALDAQASFDGVLFDGDQFGTGGDLGSDEEQDFLGLPGLLDADQVATLLRSRQAEHLGRAHRHRAAGEGSDVVDHRRLTELRKELNALVSAWARRSGTPHGVVHNRLREHSGG